MNYKNIFILTYLIFLLPSVSFSENNDSSLSTTHQFYVSGQYKPSLSYFSKFSVSVRNRDVTELLSLKENLDATISNFTNSDNFTVPYSPTYKNSLLGIGGAIGTKLNNYRIELEVFLKSLL